METENARREEQEKEGIEKQGNNEMLNDFLPIIECYLRIETLEKLISKISKCVRKQLLSIFSFQIQAKNLDDTYISSRSR